VIIADTSGLYAILNRRQPEHRAARASVERDGGPPLLAMPRFRASIAAANLPGTIP
jgi:hypothetical protein